MNPDAKIALEHFVHDARRGWSLFIHKQEK
jgi:hypothetical protein